MLLLSEPAVDAMAEVVALDLVPTVYTRAGPRGRRSSRARAGRPLEVEVKVDTGMHRVGADPGDVPAIARAVVEAPWLTLRRAVDPPRRRGRAGRPVHDEQLGRFEHAPGRARRGRASPRPARCTPPTRRGRSPTPRPATTWCAAASRSTATCPSPALGRRSSSAAARRRCGRRSAGRPRCSCVRELAPGSGRATGGATRSPSGPTSRRSRSAMPTACRGRFSARAARCSSAAAAGRSPGAVTMDQLIVDCGAGLGVRRGRRGRAHRAPGRRGGDRRGVGGAARHHLLRDPLSDRAASRKGPPLRRPRAGRCRRGPARRRGVSRGTKAAALAAAGALTAAGGAYAAARAYRARRRRSGAGPDPELSAARRRPPRAMDLRDGGRLHAVECGAGPPLVLLHGAGLAADVWAYQLRDLAESHRVVAVDLRGHGSSAAGSEGITVTAMADDVAELLDGSTIEGPLWRATRWAGWSCCACCAATPTSLGGRVRALALVSTSGGIGLAVPAGSRYRGRSLKAAGTGAGRLRGAGPTAPGRRARLPRLAPRVRPAPPARARGGDACHVAGRRARGLHRTVA